MYWDETAPCGLCGGIFFAFQAFKQFGYVVKYCKKDGVGVVINPKLNSKYGL